MINKKRMLAMSVSGAMIVSALAGCAGNSGAGNTTTAAVSGETTAATETTQGTESNTDPALAGKVIDFEDGLCDFVKVSAGSLLEDAATVSVAEFNGSKALKVTPNSIQETKLINLGIDVSSILGDKVSEVKSVKMDIGVLTEAGEFYPCAGNLYMDYSDMAGVDGSWVAYIDTKNPTTATASFGDGESYDASKKNVMIVNKASGSGNNADTAFVKAGTMSTMYIDNIMFLDKDGNALDVKTDVAFDAPEDFGFTDWSNLINVAANQVIIPGWADSGKNGWSQGDWHQNFCVVDEKIKLKDENGNVVYKQKVDRKTGELVFNDDGTPVYTKTPLYVQATDADGNLLFDEDGNEIAATEPVNQGEFDFGAIMKPGTVFTIYYTAEESEDLNHYIWFVFTTGDADLLAKYPDEGNRRLGWQRLLDAPTACQDGPGGLTYGEFTVEQSKGWLFTLNDSHTMAQVTYDEIALYFERVLNIDISEIDWNGLNFSLQCEAGMAWNVSAVTYATDAY